MTLAQLIPWALNISMGALVLTFGLRIHLRDANYLFRHPGLLARSILSMNIVMPVIAIGVALLFNLHPAIKIALVALAFSPVPPILPGKQVKAGGTSAYVASLLFVMALLAIVIVPLGILFLSWFLDNDAAVTIRQVAPAVLITVVVPMLLGIWIHHAAPDLANAVAKPLSVAAIALLIVACVPILLGSWHLILSMIGNGTLIALIAFALVGLAAGHFLGGPNPDDRGVLALATATRHPGVALAVAGATFPDEKAVLAVVLLHLVVSAIVCGPYVKWRTRAHNLARADAG